MSSNNDTSTNPSRRNALLAISKFADYPEYNSELERLRTTYPDQFAFHSESKSCDGGFPLTSITVGDTSKPAIFFVGVLHGRNEWSMAKIILRFAEKLVDPSDNQAEFNSAFLERYCHHATQRSLDGRVLGHVLSLSSLDDRHAAFQPTLKRHFASEQMGRERLQG